MATALRPLQTIKGRPVVRPLMWRKKRYMGQQLAKLQPMVCSRLAALLHQGVVLLTTMDRPDAARWPCRSTRRAGWHNVVSWHFLAGRHWFQLLHQSLWMGPMQQWLTSNRSL